MIPGLGKSSGEGKGVFWPEESMDCIVHGVPKSQTGLSNFHFGTLPYHYTCNLMNALFLFSYPLCVCTFALFKISFTKFLHVINIKNCVLVASLKYSKADQEISPLLVFWVVYVMIFSSLLHVSIWLFLKCCFKFKDHEHIFYVPFYKLLFWFLDWQLAWIWFCDVAFYKARVVFLFFFNFDFITIMGLVIFFFSE